MSFLRFFAMVPEKWVYVVERFGRFHKIMNSGLGFMVPVMDRIAYRHCLKEESIDIDKQTVITKDNVSLMIDGVLFIRVEDAQKASYKIENPQDSIRLLALTVMRSEIGKLKLDELLQERDKINKEIHEAVNKASQEWGVTCLRYEILGIDPPQDIRKAMQFEVEAERIKRQKILISEAKKIAKINVEDGKKQSAINVAQGRAQAVNIIARKEKEANESLNKVLVNPAMRNYILMNQYFENYKELLEQSNVLVAPKTAEGQPSNSAVLAMAMMGINNNRTPTFTNLNLEQTEKKVSEKITTTTQSSKQAATPKVQFYDDPELMSDTEELPQTTSEYNMKSKLETEPNEGKTGAFGGFTR